MSRQHDLFDDSTMTFGEHLEVLRVHLIRAILGLAVAMTVTMYYGEEIIKLIREPVDAALDRAARQNPALAKPINNMEGFDFFGTVQQWFTSMFWSTPPASAPEKKSFTTDKEPRGLITINLAADQLAKGLHDLDPEQYPVPSEKLQGATLSLEASSEAFVEIRKAIKRIDDPVTLNVQEAFMTYIKVSMIAGLIVASPWVFYQIWLFVAAGLYPHERKYVYIYLPLSIGLFLGGAMFCFYGVFPTVLDFLLGFNTRMGITAQIRISEWISFAVMMPLMFGVAFQLPLVMLFLQKLSIVDVKLYREQRRLAILAISILSAVLTPTPDPASMLMMMVPLLMLYELGIWLCVWTNPTPEPRTALSRQ